MGDFDVDNVDKFSKTPVFPPFSCFFLWITWISVFSKFLQHFTNLCKLHIISIFARRHNKFIPMFIAGPGSSRGIAAR